MQMLELTQSAVDQAERDETAKAMSDQFSHFVNIGRRRTIENLALCSMRDHPTLLQQKMEFCVRFIELMSQRKGDLRTEASEALARKIVENTDERDRALPLI